jgi:hypothetical protein
MEDNSNDFVFLLIEILIKILYYFLMSYIPPQGSQLNQFIPNYVVHSDYLPNNKVVEGHQVETASLVNHQVLS